MSSGDKEVIEYPLDCSEPMYVFHGRRIKEVEKNQSTLLANQEDMKDDISEIKEDIRGLREAVETLINWKGMKEVSNGYTEKEISELKNKKNILDDRVFQLCMGIALIVITAIITHYYTLG